MSGVVTTGVYTCALQISRCLWQTQLARPFVFIFLRITFLFTDEFRRCLFASTPLLALLTLNRAFSSLLLPARGRKRRF